MKYTTVGKGLKGAAINGHVFVVSDSSLKGIPYSREYNTHLLFRFLSGVQFKRVVYSRGCSYLILKPFFDASFWRCLTSKTGELLPKVKEIWDINPETQKTVELEEIPDIDELENNELLVDDI